MMRFLRLQDKLPLIGSSRKCTGRLGKKDIYREKKLAHCSKKTWKPTWVILLNSPPVPKTGGFIGDILDDFFMFILMPAVCLFPSLYRIPLRTIPDLFKKLRPFLLREVPTPQKYFYEFMCRYRRQ